MPDVATAKEGLLRMKVESKVTTIIDAAVCGRIAAQSESAPPLVRPDFDSTWIRGVDFRLRNKDIGAPRGKAVYLGAQVRWRIGGGP